MFIDERLLTILAVAGFGIYWLNQHRRQKRSRAERLRNLEREKQQELEKDRDPKNRDAVFARYLQQCDHYKSTPLSRDTWEKARDEQIKGGPYRQA